MNRENTPWQAASTAKVEWLGDDTPSALNYSDFYYSSEDGLAESRHVFLASSDLQARWQTHNRDNFVVGETGFGTGLNFLLTWQSWRALPLPRPRLHYTAAEKYPMTHGDLSRALAAWPALQLFANLLLDAYPPPIKGQHRLLFDEGQVTLDLHFEDAGAAFSDLAERGNCLIDAWYLDGFTPSRNPDLWRPDLLKSVAQLTQPGGTVATFTAASQVRRDLQAAGFAMEKFPGFGKKRESLRGHLARVAKSEATKTTPWDLSDRPGKQPSSAIVLGAGLAGCQVAAALARRGVSVTLIDQASVASGASGNSQGVLYTRLSRKHSALSDFALQSFIFAGTSYSDLFKRGLLTAPVDGDLCGCLSRNDDEHDLSYLAEAISDLPELARVVSAAAASDLTGLNLKSGGYWYPGSGWLNPAAVCQTLVNTDGITLLEHTGKVQLHADAACWVAKNDSGVLASADCAVIATGASATSHQHLDWLPLRSIRGQTTHLPTSAPLQSLRSVFCHEGYIAPARQGEHCLGATFDLTRRDSELRTADHDYNLDTLAAAVPDWQEALVSIDRDALDGRVGFRCASPDYLPLVGPIPDRPQFLQTFAALRNNARQRIDVKGNYVPGLFLNTAHGSRGLTSTPLAGELLAGLICNEPLPLPRQLCRSLAPARFLIRDLSRNRI
jgi:tRNA 5-methylaminomethyl-2-thiouridine biosynthesis bifunctional protein